ncbi:MAG TPA: hypothetical protein VN948_21030 [Terriglobales bacterium]|nr:hypothetical protein [Terriglobales bacterium]
MVTNPVQRSQVAQHEAAAKAAPRPNAAPQQASRPQDKVTISPQAQAHAKAQAQAKAKPTPSADKHLDGDKK